MDVQDDICTSLKKIQNKSLKNYNTFGINALARCFYEVSSISEIRTLIKKRVFSSKYLVLGGGSNMLLTQDFEGSVIKINLSGITILKEADNFVEVEFAAGENWHQCVLFCINNNWGGIENLSLIPGNVGAAPIQNIGAYGVEIKDLLVQVHAIGLRDGEELTFANSDCEFGYRSSIFKEKLKGSHIVTSVVLRLSKSPNHRLNLDYGDIRTQLSQSEISNPTISDVSRAVISIRSSKLPDPSELGNSGSFFKNPLVPPTEIERLLANFPELRWFKVDEMHCKLAAGWLIEQCGWKGKRVGNVGSHSKQALVLVNYGQAKGQEVLELARQIIDSVYNKFEIKLEAEVNIIT
ncbi:MAG: UDP-N-acetylmuramate dehydrogenase [Bacteroidia bacterium]|jgi:UDP-N-acetylmuramate dehydrogenase